MEIPKHLSKRDQQLAEHFGGADLADYTTPDTVPYCDKGNHKASSLFHAPQHINHWKKVEREQRNRHIQNETEP